MNLKKDLNQIIQENLDGYQPNVDYTRLWNTLEPRIAKKKNRRFIWFILLGVITGFGSLFMITQMNNQSTITTTLKTSVPQEMVIEPEQLKTHKSEIFQTQEHRIKKETSIKTGHSEDLIKSPMRNSLTTNEESPFLSDLDITNDEEIVELPATLSYQEDTYKKEEPVTHFESNSIRLISIDKLPAKELKCASENEPARYKWAGVLPIKSENPHHKTMLFGIGIYGLNNRVNQGNLNDFPADLLYQSLHELPGIRTDISIAKLITRHVFARLSLGYTLYTEKFEFFEDSQTAGTFINEEAFSVGSDYLSAEQTGIRQVYKDVLSYNHLHIVSLSPGIQITDTPLPNFSTILSCTIPLYQKYTGVLIDENRNVVTSGSWFLNRKFQQLNPGIALSWNWKSTETWSSDLTLSYTYYQINKSSYYPNEAWHNFALGLGLNF